MSYRSILDSVQRYYGEKVRAHGATASGVDWNSPESQRLRFAELLKLVDRDQPFTINDYGCGYGALAGYLRDEGYSFSYVGFDISSEMIATAKEVHGINPQIVFVTEESAITEADYTLASGIFNVKLETPAAEWQEYVLHTLETIAGQSSKGFAFNVLTTYSDPEFMREYLYYADPLFLFDYCKTRFSRFVALLHDYPLYEFTILVRKSS